MILLGLWVGAAVLAQVQASQPQPQDDPFLWGVSNSAFQVEGTPADSNWYHWTHEPGHISDGSNADVATDFWNRYDTDFALAQELGASAFRMSIAWDRIEPSPGHWDEAALGHYEQMITDMRARGLEPVITLFHSDLPNWQYLEGGTLAGNFDREFAAYAVAVVSRLAGAPARVKYWLTFNEPTTYAEGAYIDGQDPPGKSDRVDLFLESIHAQAKAHIRAVRALRLLPFDLHVSAAQDWEVFQAEKPGDGFERWIAGVPAKIYNRAFLDPTFKAHTLDFIGLNYYTRKILGLKFKPPFVFEIPGPGPHDQLGSEMYPAGIELAAKDAYAHYHLPVLFTENGTADPTDKIRYDALEQTLAVLAHARTEVPILGYLHWSLTDNFEWSSGFTPRLGLVEIDYATLERKPRPSFFLYQKLIQAAR